MLSALLPEIWASPPTGCARAWRTLAAASGDLWIMMTRMVIMTSEAAKHDPVWPVADAKARFSEMIDRALSEGPQMITRKGQRTVIVVSAEEWDRRTRRQGSLADFFAASPLRGSGLKVERSTDGPRELDL